MVRTNLRKLYMRDDTHELVYAFETASQAIVAVDCVGDGGVGQGGMRCHIMTTQEQKGVLSSHLQSATTKVEEVNRELNCSVEEIWMSVAIVDVWEGGR